jgi:hypothetical protein
MPAAGLNARQRALPLFACLALACSLAPSRAADSARFTEILNDQVKCAEDPDLGEVSCLNFSGGTFVIHGRFFTDGAVSNLDLSTVTNVEISVGAWSFSGGPENAALVRPKKLTFPLTHEVSDENDNVTIVRHGIVRLRNVPDHGLVLDVSAKAGSSRLGEIQGFGLESFVLSTIYEGENSGPVTNADTATIQLNTAAAAYSASVDLPITGQVTTRTITARDDAQYTLTRVKLKGKSP